MSWLSVVRIKTLVLHALVLSSSAGFLTACKPVLLDPNKLPSEVVGEIVYPGAGSLSIVVSSTTSAPSLPMSPTFLNGETPTSLYSITPALSTGLDAFLDFNTLTGVISITGSAPSTVIAPETYTVSVNTDQGKREATITIDVVLTIAPPNISYSPNPMRFKIGTNSSIVPTNTGGAPTSFAISGADQTALTNAGLTFNTATGVISGSATSAMALRTIAITATNPSGPSPAFNLDVEARATPTVSYTSPSYFEVGVAESLFPTSTSVDTYSISGSDNTFINARGITFDTSTGEFAGTATSAFTRTIVVTATNTVDTATFSLDLQAQVAPVLSYAPATKYFTVGTNSPISPTIVGTSVVFSIPGADNSALVAAGLSFNTSTGVFSGSATSAMASRVITITATNGVGSDTFPLTVEALVAASLSYVTPKYFTVGVNDTLTPTVTGTSVTYSIPGADNSALVAAGLSFNTSTGAFSGSATSAMASRVITVSATNSVGTVTFDVTVEAQVAPTLSYVTPKYFTVGVNDTLTPTVGGTNVSYSIPGADNSALVAAGLSFSITTGVIGGSATSAMASRAIVVTATNNVGSVNFTVTVAALAAATISYSPSTRYFTVGTAGSVSPTVTGTSVTYSIPGADNSALVAAGLSFNTSTGVISGTPSATMASRTITVTATNLVSAPTTTITVEVFAAPTKVVIASATTGITTDCITYSVQTQDGTNTPTAVSADRTVTLGGAGTNGNFFSGAGCTGVIGSVVIAAGTHTSTVYYRKTSPGSVTLTGTSAPLTAASLGVTISVAPPTAVTLTGSLTPTTASCAAYTITTRDAYGNASPVTGGDKVVTLSDGAAAGDFYATAICNFGGSAVTSATVLDGASTATVYYKMPSTGSSTLSAVVATVNTGTVTINVGISTAAKLSLSLNPTSTQTAGSCVEVTINTRDAGDNLINLSAGAITVNLTASPNGTFYSGAGCSGVITSIGMANGTQAQTVYFTRTVATVATQATTLTASRSGGGFADGTAAINFIPGLMFQLAWDTTPTAANMRSFDNLAWDSSPATTVNGNTCSRFRAKIQDQYNNDTTAASTVTVTPVDTSDGAFYSDTDTDCNGAPAVPTLQITTGNTFSQYFRYRKPTTGALSITATGDSGVATSTAFATTLSNGAPTQFVYSTTPTAAKINVCSQFTIDIRDSANQLVPAPKAAGYTLLLGDGSTGAFYGSLANCNAQTSPITSLVFGSQVNQASYWYRRNTNSTPGSITLTATEAGGLTDPGSRSITISTGSVTNITYSTNLVAHTHSNCQTLVVQSRDENNQASNPGSTININLSTNAGDGTFFSTAGCTGVVTTRSISTAANSVTYYFRKASAGSNITVTADATGGVTQTLVSASVTVSNPAGLPALTINGATTLAAGVCSPYSITRASGATNHSITLTAPGATAVAYYVDAACTLNITSFSMGTGLTSGTFYVMGAISGETATLTAAHPSYTTGTRTLTITP